MPYNNSRFGDAAKKLTKSPFVQSGYGAEPNPPPEGFFLVTDTEDYLITDTEDFLVTDGET
jgi:hypothetical protein